MIMDNASYKVKETVPKFIMIMRMEEDGSDYDFQINVLTTAEELHECHVSVK